MRPPSTRGRLGGELVRRRAVSRRGRRRRSPPARRGADLLDDLGAALGVAAADDDMCAFGGERERDRAADVAGGAGDQRRLVSRVLMVSLRVDWTAWSRTVLDRVVQYHHGADADRQRGGHPRPHRRGGGRPRARTRRRRHVAGRHPRRHRRRARASSSTTSRAARPSWSAAIAAFQCERVLDAQRPYLDALDSLESWERWRDAVVRHYRDHLACPISAMSAEAGVDVRPHMDRWFTYLRAGVDDERTALAIFAALQGGLALMKAAHSIEPLEAALDGALVILRAGPPSRRSRPPRRSAARPRPDRAGSAPRSAAHHAVAHQLEHLGEVRAQLRRGTCPCGARPAQRLKNVALRPFGSRFQTCSLAISLSTGSAGLPARHGWRRSRRRRASRPAPAAARRR